MLLPGDPAPWFVQRSSSRPDYQFDTVAGRVVVLCFFASAEREATRAMLEALWRRTDLFDDERAAFFGVSCDSADAAENRVRQALPGFRLFWDFDLAVSRRYGLVTEGDAPDQVGIARTSFVLDANLRVIAALPIDDPARHAEAIAAAVGAALPPCAGPEIASPWAPVLLLPRVFEPEFCRRLIGLYEASGGGVDSGFMTERAGKTVGVLDHGHKRRRDFSIRDETVRAAIRARIVRRLSPEIEKAFAFRPTRLERYLVACYDAAEGGHFRPHRDNSTKGTAHRRFAVTINLNAEEHEGGDLRFPEYDGRLYRAPTGGAIVFSCRLLHEATPVTRGRRYAFLPFLYDEDAASIRRANLDHLGDETLRDELAASIRPPRV